MCHPVFLLGAVGLGHRDDHVYRMSMLFVQGVEFLKREFARRREVAFQAGQVALPHLVKECVGGKAQVVQHRAGQTQIGKALLPVGMALSVLCFQITQALHQIG